MTKKDYIKFAAAFASTKPEPRMKTAHVQWKRDISALVTILATDNPRFDTSRFLDACNF